jgi:3-phenylpropionate/trans-cinnamate dioxygenase ferredoxin reductase component
MGFVGCKVAASLTQLGVRVTAIFPQRAPLEKVLGDALGAPLAAIHQAKGVELRPQDQRARFEGTDRVVGFHLLDGQVLAAVALDRGGDLCLYEICIRRRRFCTGS